MSGRLEEGRLGDGQVTGQLIESGGLLPALEQVDQPDVVRYLVGDVAAGPVQVGEPQPYLGAQAVRGSKQPPASRQAGQRPVDLQVRPR